MLLLSSYPPGLALVKDIKILVTRAAVGLGGSGRVIFGIPYETRWHTHICLHVEDQLSSKAKLHTGSEVVFHDIRVTAPEVFEAAIHQIVDLSSRAHTYNGSAS